MQFKKKLEHLQNYKLQISTHRIWNVPTNFCCLRLLETGGIYQLPMNIVQTLYLLVFVLLRKCLQHVFGVHVVCSAIIWSKMELCIGDGLCWICTVETYCSVVS